MYDEKYDHPLTARIVLTLLDRLLEKGYCLYIDRFYTSPALADTLVEMKTDCVGTLRLNRKEVQKKVKEGKLKKVKQWKHSMENLWY